MRDRYDKELVQLKADLTEMGSMCSDIVSLVLESLKNYDDSKVEEINNALSEISRFERSIESNCMRLIMRQQPIASDLRNIRSSMFIIYDMERLGIQSSEIAAMMGYVSAHPEQIDEKIFSLGEATVKMTKDSIAACESMDEKAAVSVIKYDDTVDNLFQEAKKALIEAIQTEGSDGESLVDKLMIAKYFERMADHAESISRWVYFSKTGDRYTE